MPSEFYVWYILFDVKVSWPISVVWEMVLMEAHVEPVNIVIFRGNDLISADEKLSTQPI